MMCVYQEDTIQLCSRKVHAGPYKPCHYTGSTPRGAKAAYPRIEGNSIMSKK